MIQVLVGLGLCVVALVVLVASAGARAAGVWNDDEDGSLVGPSRTENDGE